MTSDNRLLQINDEIQNKKDVLNLVHSARMDVRSYNAAPVETKLTAALLKGTRTFKLLAQGDSWFDYPIGTDIIDCLHKNHGHEIVNIAVAGSTLNDEVYGPVPREMFGLPVGTKQSDDPSRIVELVHRIQQDKPQGLLISAGGNDIAGDEFFSFINNALSGLPHVNDEVLNGVINGTFKTAYQHMIEVALEAAGQSDNGHMCIFLHGYDYPWPDGRGVISFLGWRVGPWFDDTFNHKNYPYVDDNMDQLRARHDIVVKLIDAMNDMLADLASQFVGKVFHTDLRNTLQTKNDWANELHPTNDGFAALAVKIDAGLQNHMP